MYGKNPFQHTMRNLASVYRQLTVTITATSITMQWTGLVARRGKKIMHIKF